MGEKGRGLFAIWATKKYNLVGDAQQPYGDVITMLWSALTPMDKAGWEAIEDHITTVMEQEVKKA